MKLLDCTLRDGGYYTDWDFDNNLVETYLKSFNTLPIDYLEVGYRSIPLKGYQGEYFYCPIHVLERIKAASDKKLVVILNEKDIRPEAVEELLRPCLGLVAMVRLAVDPENFERAILLGKAVKELGFELCFNVMYMSSWSDNTTLMDNLHHLDGLADYLYMVDSYGGVYPEDVVSIVRAIRERTSIPLGFHGHDNLSMGLINTLTALREGVEILDATITGMGRGAGNLKMELLLTALNSRYDLPLDFNALSEVVVAFERLQQVHGWGTNLPYMVSGAHSLPQKEVMEWTAKRMYSMNSIVRALQNQKENVRDNRRMPLLRAEEKATNLIVIGGGPSAEQHAVSIARYIASQTNIAIIHASAKNASFYQHLDVPQYFCLVGNEGYRLEDVFNRDMQSFKGICVLPPFPRKMGTYIPTAVEEVTFELESLTFTPREDHSHTAIALQTAVALQADNVVLVGYDGYTGTHITQLERGLATENERLFVDYKTFTGQELYSLLPTAYSELTRASIFARI